GGDCLLVYEIDMRYRGQHHELTVSVPPPPWTPKTVEEILSRFYIVHEQMNGYAVEDEEAQFVNFRLVMSVPVARQVIPQGEPERTGARPEPVDMRPVLWDDEPDFVETLVFQRRELRPGDVVTGPAIVEQLDSTIAIPPRAEALVDT